MWRYVLLALALCGEAEPLRALSRDKSGRISNLELLIPLQLSPRVQHKQHAHQSIVMSRADEPYSDIPADAFKLDRGEALHRPRYEAGQARSLYLKDRGRGGTSDGTSSGTSSGQHDICRERVRGYAGAARGLLLNVCTELLRVLAPRCRCCGHSEQRDRAVGRRRQFIHIGPDAILVERYLRSGKFHRKRRVYA